GRNTMWRDLQVGLRALARTPGMVLTSVGTLAIAITAATTVFALVDGVLLRPLPVRDQAALTIGWREPQAAASGHAPFSATDREPVAAGSRPLSAVAGVGWRGATELAVIERGGGSLLRVAHVTGSFFDVLDAGPVRGRMLRPTDDRTGAEPVLVIS